MPPSPLTTVPCIAQTIKEAGGGQKMMELVACRGDHQSTCSGVSVVPRISKAATSSWDGTVKVWDLAASSKRPVGALESHCGRVMCCEWNAQGSVVASGSEDLTIKLWDPRGSEDLITMTATSPVMSVAWNPLAEHEVAAGLEDGSVLLYDVRSTGTMLRKVVRYAVLVPHGCRALLTYPVCLPQHTHSGCVAAVAFNSDGALASGGDDTIVHVTQGESTKYARGLWVPLVFMQVY